MDVIPPPYRKKISWWNKLFFNKKDSAYIIVSETDSGILCETSPYLHELDTPFKHQIKAFLQGCIDRLNLDMKAELNKQSKGK